MRLLFLCSSRYNVSKIALDHTNLKIEYVLPSNNLERFFNLLKTSNRNYNLILIDGHRFGLTFGGLYSKFRNMPLVIRLRGNVWEESEDKFISCSNKILNRAIIKIGDQFLKSSHLIIPVSEYLKKKILEHTFFNPKNMFVIPPAIDTNYFSLCQNGSKTIARRNYSSKKELIILLVTNFNYYQKIQPLLDYLSSFKKIIKYNNNIKILILGTGKYLPIIENIYKESNVKNVFFLGFKKNIKYYYSISDIFLHLSYLDAFGKVVIEAESMELPVVVIDSCGLSETLLDNNTGYLVHNENELMDRIFALVDDSDLRYRMGTNGRRFIINTFSTRIIGKQFSILLDRIVDVEHTVKRA